MPERQAMPASDPKALLRRLLSEPQECEWLEFKHNDADPEEIGKCVSACANASMLARRDRAFMVWGVENDTKTRLGTTARWRRIKRGGENLQNFLGRMLDPSLMLEYLEFEDTGQTFLILIIDPTYDRPVRFSGTEYIRIGENIRLLRDHPEHERALWLATGTRRFESATALAHQRYSDLVQTLDIEAYYALAGQARPKTRAEIIRHFTNHGFIKEDWEGSYDITNLGALLLARDISQFPSIAGKSVRIIRYAGLDKKHSGGETEISRGYAVGFLDIHKQITDSLPKEERFRRGVRRLISTYSEIAIREILANALIHQDFTIRGAGPIVEIYSDRVEISNPGNSLIERDRIIDERMSRNEKLAKAMRDLGLCEERGGGIDKAIYDCEARFLPAPEFIASTNAMRVIVFGPRKFSELSKNDRIWSCFCHCVIRWLRGRYMNNTSLRARFSLGKEDYQAVSVVIADARRAGRIVPADPKQGKRNAKYVPYWAREQP